MVSLICAGTNGCANNRYAGDLRRHRVHYDVTVMIIGKIRKAAFEMDLSYHVISIELSQFGQCVQLITLRPGQNGRRFWRRHSFSNTFCGWKCLYFNSTSTEIWSQWCIWQYVSICIDDGLVTNGQQVIIWANDDPVYWSQWWPSSALPDGTKPLPEPVLTYHQHGPVTFIRGQLHKEHLNNQSVKFVWKFII